MAFARLREMGVSVRFLINPELVASYDTVSHMCSVEGCLSRPDKTEGINKKDFMALSLSDAAVIYSCFQILCELIQYMGTFSLQLHKEALKHTVGVHRHHK